GWFETRFSLKPQVMRYEAVGAHADKVMAEINRVLEEEHHVTESVQIASSELGFRVYFTIDATRKEHDDVLEKLRESPIFKRVAILRERTGEGWLPARRVPLVESHSLKPMHVATTFC